MHIITRKRLNDFIKKYPDSRTGLTNWYHEVKKRDFRNFNELRAIFPAADQIGKLTVFNIGGNKYRLIVAIHYNRKRIYIRAVLTHKEYDEEKWKE